MDRPSARHREEKLLNDWYGGAVTTICGSGVNEENGIGNTKGQDPIIGLV